MAYGNRQLRRLYYSLPLTAKNLIASIYGWNQRRIRYGETYREHLAFLHESQYWPNERLFEYQQQRVGTFLRNVIPRTPYYRSHNRYLELADEGAPLDEFPIVVKSQLRQQISDFYHDDSQSMRCQWSQTSGTTGSSISFPVSGEHVQRENAFRALAYEWGGVTLDGRERLAFFAGHPVTYKGRHTPPFWIYDSANAWLYFSSYHLTRQNIRSYLRELERFNPIALAGYPSALYLLALAFEKFGGSLNLRSIFVSSETLLDWQRARIEKALGAKIFNYYGSAENCAHIAECEQGELHLKLEHSAVSVLQSTDAVCQPGETGRLVGTGFDNYAFPLIRYDIGDEITIAENQVAKCGRGGLLIENIFGRVEDYIFTPDGRFVGRLDHLFKNSKNVLEAQLYQEKVDELVCRIVRSEKFSVDDEQEIIDEARARLGPSIEIRLEYVDEIPRTNNGKFRFVVSTINQSQMLDEFAG